MNQQANGLQATTDLSVYDNPDYSPGASTIKQLLWYVVNAVFFINPLNPLSGLKVRLLKIFGAKIGAGVVIKPAINIKYPWRLTIGNHCWIGEKVWIDNLVDVILGSHVCLSQGAVLITGSHNYKKSTFDLITKPITLEDGVWIGAFATVTGGCYCSSHSVLAAGSVANQSLEPYTIYQGNPAVAKRPRTIQAL